MVAQGNYFVLSGTALWTAAATANPFNDFKTVKDLFEAIEKKLGE